MGWISGVVVYILTWWIVIFAVLPFGLRRDETGKPENLNLGRKILITSVISALIWIIIYFLIEADIISFRDIARTMVEEDRSP